MFRAHAIFLMLAHKKKFDVIDIAIVYFEFMYELRVGWRQLTERKQWFIIFRYLPTYKLKA